MEHQLGQTKSCVQNLVVILKLEKIVNENESGCKQLESNEIKCFNMMQAFFYFDFDLQRISHFKESTLQIGFKDDMT